MKAKTLGDFYKIQKQFSKMTQSAKQKIGQRGEDIAANYLKRKGYQILARGWKNKWGEIDITTKKKGKIVFFEVKTIREKPGFAPEDEINEKKKGQLRKMAQIYLSANKISFDTAYQIDILAIEIGSKNPKVHHIENAIEDIY